ncbi:MAG TPA: YceD family protein [Candidatus Lumbricidophila sp.]|nr:YceD family protein [Candidatus Lumbricidophila sp.]
MHRPGEMRERSVDIAAPEAFGEGLVAVAAGTNVHLEVRLESVHDGILATVEVDTTADGECGRCLDPITQSVEVEFQELFAYHSGEAIEAEVQDDHVDLEPFIRDAVVLSLPFQPVCRADCPGLDPDTGLPLAGHTDTSTNRDPRWAALAGFEASTGEAVTSDVAAETKD